MTTVAEARTKVVGVRLTEVEYAELAAAAERLHTSPVALLRLCWFEMKRKDDDARSMT